MESIAIPLSFLVLVWVFGGLLAAALPMASAGSRSSGRWRCCALITFATDVSIFALNLSIALGLALAIDYTLLIISRYRDELADGADRDEALIRTMATAGRTVLFSAMTVALSMVAMVLFPMYFLKSFAYAGIAVVAFAAVAAVVVTPAAIVLLGDRLDSLDVRRLVRRVLRRPEPVPKPVEQMFWYRSTKFVMRRAVPIGLAVIALLLVLGAPVPRRQVGLPRRPRAAHVGVGASGRRPAAQRLRRSTPRPTSPSSSRTPTGVTPAETRAATPRELSRVPDVSSVSAPGGTFVGGRQVGPPSAATAIKDGSAFLTVGSTAPLFSDALRDAARPAARRAPDPAADASQLTGIAQINRDSVEAITSRLPLVLGVIAAITFVLLFLLTGSVVLPLKALCSTSCR